MIFDSKYLGMFPFQCPSLFSILAFLEYEYGVFHPTEGCSAVSDKMAVIARDMGVDVRLDEPVEQLHFKDRKVVGLRTRTGNHMFESLVINADFAQAMQHLVPNHLRKQWPDKRIEKSKNSCSTFMLYLGIEDGTTTCSTTRFTSRRTTSGTWMRSIGCRCCPKTLHTMCRTRGSPIPRWPRRG